MIFQNPVMRVACASIFVLGLCGCAGGANVYAQPIADFAGAVEQTSRAVRTYASLEQHLMASDDLARASQGGAAVGFVADNCDVLKPAATCQLTDFKNGKALLPQTSTAVPPQVILMGKMQTYAQLLVSIAGAASAADLQARQSRAQSAYGDLIQGVKDVQGKDFTAAKGALKSAMADGLGSLYLENKRIKLLAALVQAGNPAVEALVDQLEVLSDDGESQFVISQRSRIGQLVDNFDVLGTVYSAKMTGVEMARYQVLRRSVLNDAARETATLQAVLSANPKAVFGEMKAAHGALLRALTLADSDLGKAMVAIENFSAAASKARNAIDVMKGMQ